MIILDTNALVTWMVSDAGSDNHARMSELLRSAKEGGVDIGIPAPVFAEFLVRTDTATAELLQAFERKRSVRVLPFDKRCAHECAILDRAAISKKDKKGGSREAWQKIKIDRQILAIARVAGVTLLVTDDAHLLSQAASLGISASKLHDLPIPDAAKQLPLVLQQDGGASVEAPPAP